MKRITLALFLCLVFTGVSGQILEGDLPHPTKYLGRWSELILDTNFDGIYLIAGDSTWVVIDVDSLNARAIAVDSINVDRIVYSDTYWDDLRVPLTNTFLNPNKSEPEFEDTGDGIFAFAFETDNDSAESLHFIAQMPHNYKEGTDLKAHVHWMPSSTNADDVVWKLIYKIASEGHSNSAMSAVQSARVIDAANGTALTQQETELVDIDGTNIKISGILIGNITRLGDAAADDFTGIAYGLELDFHYEVDSPGSRDEEVK